MNVICDEMEKFLYDNVSKQYFNYQLSGNNRVVKYDSASKYNLNNVKNASVQWHVEGGFITNQTNEEIRVIWFNSHQPGTITVCITNENGLSCKKELNVSII
jgi:membrane carboxypeptidase/penicillin-binding protein PbpC